MNPVRVKHCPSLVFLGCLCAFGAALADGTRARDLGIPFAGQPGSLNAITDVAGVEVGHVTLTEGEGELIVGDGPVRTGVTVIHPGAGTPPKGSSPAGLP